MHIGLFANRDLHTRLRNRCAGNIYNDFVYKKKKNVVINKNIYKLRVRNINHEQRQLIQWSGLAQ